MSIRLAAMFILIILLSVSASGCVSSPAIQQLMDGHAFCRSKGYDLYGALDSGGKLYCYALDENRSTVTRSRQVVYINGKFYFSLSSGGE